MKLLADTIDIGYHSPILQDIHLDLPENGLVSMVGRNGVGKSTLLRTLAGLLPCLAGEVKVDGRPLTNYSANHRARMISFVPSSIDDIGSMSVVEYVALGRLPYVGLLRRFSPEDRDIVHRTLERFDIDRFSGRAIGELSDGERQRVGIAKAVAQSTPVILLDEPTSFLDLSARVRILRLLKEIGQESLILFSTHDLALAGQLSDRMMLLDEEHTILSTPADLLDSKALDSIFEDEAVSIKSPDFRIVIE